MRSGAVGAVVLHTDGKKNHLLVDRRKARLTEYRGDLQIGFGRRRRVRHNAQGIGNVSERLLDAGQ